MRNRKLIIVFSVVCAITLLIVLSSVIFSVQHVDAHCLNVENPENIEDVLASHKIGKNKNIFMLNKKEVTENIEKTVPNVHVINIEKIFPNRIKINYVEIKICLKYTAKDKTLYCSNDGKIMKALDTADPTIAAINLLFNEEVASTKVCDNFLPENSKDMQLIKSILSSLESLDYRDDVAQLIAQIDITGNSPVITTTTGMKWKLLGADYIAEKLRYALSVYISDTITIEDKKTATLILSGGNPVICQLERPKK